MVLTCARCVLALLGLGWLRCAAGFPQYFAARFQNDCQAVPSSSGYPYGFHGMPLPDLLGTSISLSTDDVLQTHVQAGVQYNVTVSFFRLRCALAFVSSGRLSVMQARPGDGSVTTSSCPNRIAFGASDTGDYHSSITCLLEVSTNATAGTVIQLTVVSAESEISPLYIAKLTLPLEPPAAAQAQKQQQGQPAAVGIGSGVSGSLQVVGSPDGAFGAGAAAGANIGSTTTAVRPTHNTNGVNTLGLSAADSNNTSSSNGTILEPSTVKVLPGNSSRDNVAAHTPVKGGKVSNSNSTSSSHSMTPQQVQLNSSATSISLAVPNITAAAGPTLSTRPPPDSKSAGSNSGLRPPPDPGQLGDSGPMEQQRTDNSSANSSSSNLPSSPVPVTAGSQLPDSSSNHTLLWKSGNTSTASGLMQHITAQGNMTAKSSIALSPAISISTTNRSSNGSHMVNIVNNNVSRCADSNCSSSSNSTALRPVSSSLPRNFAVTQPGWLATLKAPPPPPPPPAASNKASPSITVVTAGRVSTSPSAAATATGNTHAANWTSTSRASNSTTTTTTTATTTTTSNSSIGSSDSVVNSTAAVSPQVILHQTVTRDNATTGGSFSGTAGNNSSKS